LLFFCFVEFCNGQQILKKI